MTILTRLFACSWLLCGLCASAGPLNDPTRPPAGLMVSAPPGQGSAASWSGHRAAAAAPAPAAAEPAEPQVLPVVQSIRLSPRGLSSALVDGRLVHLGEKLNGAVVAAIDADGLLLRSKAGTQRLWLLDAIMRPGATAETRLAQDNKAPARMAAAAAASASMGTSPVATSAAHSVTALTAPHANQAPAAITLAGKKP